MAAVGNIRKGHRADVTRRLGRLADLLEEGDEVQLQSTKSVLQDKLLRLRGLDEQILEKIDDELLIEREIGTATDVEMSISEGIARIDLRLKGAAGRSGSGSNGATHRARARLPKIELQRYGGEPKSFQEWWDTFSSMVHSNSDLSNIDKFNYLKSCLTGSAKNCIQGMSTTADNYMHAVEVIQDRFGKKAVVVASHMDTLMKLPVISSSHDFKKLRVLYDRVETNVRSLQSLGIDSAAYGTLLVPVVLRSLPEDIRLILSRKFVADNDVWELDALLEALKAEVEAKERCSAMSGGPTDQRSEDANKGYAEGRTNRRTHYSTTMTVQGEQVHRSDECVYCKCLHASKNCRTVTDVVSRRQIVRDERRCYLCLGKQHCAAMCKSNVMCGKCSMRHHVSICYGDRPHKSPVQEQATGQSARSTQQMREGASHMQMVEKDARLQAENATLLVDGKKHTLLETAKVTTSSVHGGSQVRARIILDKCSHRSFITESFRRKLRLKKLGSEPMNVKGFGGKTTQFEKVDVVQVRIHGDDGTDVAVTTSVVPTICLPPSSKKVKFAKETFKHLFELQLADDPEDHTADDEIEMLIGADYYWSIVKDEIQRGEEGPVAQASRCGWILSGPLNRVDVVETEQTLLIHSDPIAEVLTRFWNTESLGISATEEEDVHTQLRDTITFKEGRYEVGLPWKKAVPKLADNYRLAEKRLTSVLTKLRKDPELLEAYDKTMKSQLDAGILEEIGEARPEAGMTYYMPHLPVVRKDKDTTKLRIVYDASAKTLGRSLNQNLHEGPCLLPQLFKVLLRFRMHRIGIVADIEKAFLNIGIKEEERDFLRLLWVKDTSAESAPPWILRFTRVVFGLRSSPFHLNATLNYHLQRYQEACPSTVNEILQSLYVDDISSGADTEEGACQLYREAKSILAAAGMNLRKWASNSSDLLSFIEDEQERTAGEDEAARICADDATYANLQTENFATVGAQQQKVLGVVWDKVHDEWVFDFSKVCGDQEKLTKRSLLAKIASLYDPIGLVSPLVLPLKLTFQSICEEGVVWDSEVTDDVWRVWEQWSQGIIKSKEFRFQRCCLPMKDAKVKLVGFSDASDVAYAAAVYMVAETKNGVTSQLVAAKTRVAPLKRSGKTLTIPRKELLGSLILARLMASVREVVRSVAPSFMELYFTDAKTVLYWILNEDRVYQQYVENRANEIRSLTNKSSWRHVPGEDNPADIGTRVKTPSQFLDTSVMLRWKHGPSWLVLGEEHWPQSVDIKPTGESEVELKADQRRKAASVLVVMMDTNVVAFSRYSTLGRLLRVVAYIRRFSDNCKERTIEQRRIGSLTVKELQESERTVIQVMQETLRVKGDFAAVKLKMRLFEDDTGILRSKGRLDHADMDVDQRMPMVLPRDHHVTKLIVENAHEKVMHCGQGDTLAKLRERFAIPRMRQLIRKILFQCRRCRKVEGLPYRGRPVAPLPVYRVRLDQPFSAVGTDFAGPLLVKDRTGMVSVYVLLFTCASTRAIHLELLQDKKADTFLKGMRKFIARRGAPKLVVSDNDKTFRSQQTMTFLRDRGIEWRFNIPEAPWTGGMFERMVKATKRCLKKTVGNSSLTFEELSTLLTEVENTINNRPLTYIEEDTVIEPLTPNHLIYGRRISMYHDVEILDGHVMEVSDKSFPKRIKYRKSILLHFRNRWRQEYLTQLRQHTKSKREGCKEIQVGDVVLVHGDQKRVAWRMGRVIRLITGSDGEARAATVRVAAVGRQFQHVDRRIEKLYPLEADQGDKGFGPEECDKARIESSQRSRTKIIADKSKGSHAHGPDDIGALLAPPVHAKNGRVKQLDPNKDVCDRNMNIDRRNDRPRRAAAADADVRRRLQEM